MKKVVIIHNRLVIGGPAIAIAETIRQLHQRFSFYLIVGQPLKDERDASYLFENIPNLTIIRIASMQRMPSIWNDISAFRVLYKTIKKINPAVVHTHGTKPGLLGRIAAGRLGVPVIIHTYHGHIFHSYFHPLLSKAIIKMERRLAKKSTWIIAISTFLQDEIVHRYSITPETKIKMIPLGLDLSAFSQDFQHKRNQFRKQYGITENEVAIGIVGRITAIKQMSMFVEAIHQLQQTETYNRLKFFIIGDGEEKEKLMRLLDTYQIPFALGTNIPFGTKVIFTSWLLEMDVVMNGLDILALTSLNEGTPVSIIEAMAAQKPVVTTNAGSVQEIVKDKQNGLVSAIDDVPQFVQNLQQLILNPEHRKQMGALGKDMVLKICDPRIAAHHLGNLYEGD